MVLRMTWCYESFTPTFLLTFYKILLVSSSGHSCFLSVLVKEHRCFDNNSSFVYSAKHNNILRVCGSVWEEVRLLWYCFFCCTRKNTAILHAKVSFSSSPPPHPPILHVCERCLLCVVCVLTRSHMSQEWLLPIFFYYYHVLRPDPLYTRRTHNLINFKAPLHIPVWPSSLLKLDGAGYSNSHDLGCVS